MSKQRVRADNFEQLIEIVKAVQRGKDPEESLREKEEQELQELLAQEAGEAELPEEDRTPEEKQEDERALSRLLHRLRPGDGRNRSQSEETVEEQPERHKKESPGEDEKKPPEEHEKESPEEHAEESSEELPVQKKDALFHAWKHRKKHRKKETETVPETETKTVPEETKAAGGEEKADIPAKLKSRVAFLRDKLSQWGFQRREMAFAGAGLLLVVFMAVLIIHSVLLSRAEKRKMENVTADDGLTVLIEKEPEEWCRSYPVELTVRAKEFQVQRAAVNGISYVLDEKGRLTAEVEDPHLEISVDTEKGTLNAQAEIRMIDSQAPVVNVSREQKTITVTAGDARSEIAHLRYAVVHNNAFSNIPEYQDYSEPFEYEEDSTYYFYAQDAAGNRCIPLVSTLESADSLSLPQEEIELYPGETAYLNAQVEPEGALLNNLKYTSANPEVVTVDSFGKVTAAGVGSTVVKISADEIEDVSCKVTVGESRTVTITTIGDCTLGTDESFDPNTSFNAFDAVNGHSWFFQNVRDILSNDDATFANLEGTLTTSGQRESKQFAFKGDPSYTQILKNGSVDVVTLANNHSRDYGDQSLSDTKQYLTEAGIDYCQDAEIAVKEVNGIRTAFIGIYVLDDGMDSEEDLRAAIEAAKADKARLIIVAFHWGSERETQPDATQQELAHIAVDCGASLVVGHHPHVLQGIEKYNGAYIVYSLGNFCFGGNSTPSDMDTMIFRQSFTVTKDGVLDDDKIEIIPCSISSEAYYNNYQPTPAQGTEAERIMGRINEYSAPFGMSYTASDGLN